MDHKLYSIEKLADLLKSSASISLNQLLIYWRGRDIDQFKENPDIYKLFAERSIKIGEPLLACDIIREALATSPKVEYHKIHARALTQCGAYNSAKEVLENLIAQEHEDFDIVTLYGRIIKYISYQMSDLDLRKSYTMRALSYYRKGYESAQKTHNIGNLNYAGINLATLYMVNADYKNSYKILNEIIGRIEEKVDEINKNYWFQATLAEAYVLLKDLKSAKNFYQKAVALAHEDINSITSMRRQVQFLLKHLDEDPSYFDSIFQIPTVGCLTGLMIDHPSAQTARFPSSIISKVRKQIINVIIKNKIEIGFCSGACGSDLIFAEELINRNCEVNIILPFPTDRYRQTILEISADKKWVEIFDTVIKKASTLSILTDEMGTDDHAPYLYCNEVTEGMAALRAKSISAKLINIGVWDENDTPDLRGTAAAVSRWRKNNLPAKLISTKSMLADKSSENDRPTKAMLSSEPTHSSETFTVRNKQELVSVIFADTVGYGRITDREIPLYNEYFLGTVKKVMTDLGINDAYKNTWGDALFIVIPSITVAAELSLTLCETINQIKWQKKGLPENLNYRIALHAGPAYKMIDPITDRMNYYGYHVSKGARIEPITPPGQVYTSENFAALLTAHAVSEFTCDYVGRVPHAKDFGTFPLYHLKRRKNI